MFAHDEISDDDPRAVTIKAMTADLGVCLSAYGRIEYLFGDIIWNAWLLEEYAHLAKQHPSGPDNRIREMERIFAAPGRLENYGPDIAPLWERLKELSEGRHYFAHGHTTFFHTPGGDAAMLFRRFVPPPKGGAVTKNEIWVRPANLALAASVWSLFSASAQRIIATMYKEQGFEGPSEKPK